MLFYKFYCRAYQRILWVSITIMTLPKPQLISGAGSIIKLPAVMKEHNAKTVLVVTDKVLMSLGLLDSMLDGLKAAGIKAVIYDGTQPNPTIANAEEAKKMYIENGCDSIIAFGGGSPMDCAKIAGALVVKPKKDVRQLRGIFKVLKSLPYLAAVPTTAGTGSEATVAAVVSNPETHEKFACNDPNLCPRLAVLDPELTTGLPQHITSTTGLDALTHAVEAYIGKSNTGETFQYSEQAVRLIFANLENAYTNGKDINARDKMLLASHYAGLAFTRAYIGYVHAIAHNLGGLYNIPHGLANAVILPYILEYYGSAVYKRLAKLAEFAGIVTPELVSDEQKAKAFIAAIRAMSSRMNIPTGFEQIQEKDIELLATRALKEAHPLYPVPKIMSHDECVEIIKLISINK